MKQKKMKKQQQMTEWQRIKEEKARAEAEAAVSCGVMGGNVSS